MKLSAGVVLYNPIEQYIQNIREYCRCVDTVYIFDNSDTKNEAILEAMKNIDNLEFVENTGNKGIAYALNMIAKTAMERGCTHLLCMDQDSYIESKELYRMSDYIKSLEENHIEDAAVIAPEPEECKQNKEDIFQAAKEVITSGSIIDTRILAKLGYFKEDYFIYCVDYEYCWRARRHGYRVLKNSSISMKHQTNDFNDEHERIREISKYAIYYAARNNCYLIRQYIFVYPKDALLRLERFLRGWGGYAGVRKVKKNPCF